MKRQPLRAGLVLRCAKPLGPQGRNRAVKVGERLRLVERRPVPDLELWEGEWLDRVPVHGARCVGSVSAAVLRSHFEEVK